MSILSLRRHRDLPVEPPAERPEVRRYRYLLCTTDGPTMEGLHVEALSSLDPLVRAHILRTAQDRLLSGRDLTVDDIARVARLITIGERQTPGILVSALTDVALSRLAHAVLRSPQAEGLLEGYAGWDGEAGRSTVHVAAPATSRAQARAASLSHGA